MRIISKFHDYYDCIQKFGIDESIIYKREEEKIETILPKNIVDIIKNYPKIYIRENKMVNYEYFPSMASPFFIIIVDKCYLGIEFNSIYFYNEQSFNNYLEKNKLKVEKLNKPLLWGSMDIDIKWSIDHKCPIFFYDSDKQNESPIHYLTYYRKPYDRKYNIIKNPFLKNYEFYKVMEPFIIYQKIHQFISGILVNPEKEPWPISDKLKAESHGFDKWSFRKQASKKK
jgi:hypothetical protein